MILVSIGDSITKGTYTELGDSSPNSLACPNFTEIIAEKFKFDSFYNFGVNGTSVSSTSPVLPDSAMVSRYNEMPPADLLLVCGGTNDYGTGVFLGTHKDEKDVSFYGALYEFYSGLKNSRKFRKIVVVSPIPRACEDKNSAGHSLADYRKAEYIRAKEFGFYFIDGGKTPIDPTDKTLMNDGLHPDPAGHKVYAEYLIGYLDRILKKGS